MEGERGRGLPVVTADPSATWHAARSRRPLARVRASSSSVVLLLTAYHHASPPEGHSRMGDYLVALRTEGRLIFGRRMRTPSFTRTSTGTRPTCPCPCPSTRVRVVIQGRPHRGRGDRHIRRARAPASDNSPRSPTAGSELAVFGSSVPVVATGVSAGGAAAGSGCGSNCGNGAGTTASARGRMTGTNLKDLTSSSR